MDVDFHPVWHQLRQNAGEEVAQCDVLLAVIGPGWLEAHDEKGNRRLNNPDDFVRIEIGTIIGFLSARQDHAIAERGERTMKKSIIASAMLIAGLASASAQPTINDIIRNHAHFALAVDVCKLPMDEAQSPTQCCRASNPCNSLLILARNT